MACGRLALKIMLLAVVIHILFSFIYRLSSPKLGDPDESLLTKCPILRHLNLFDPRTSKSWGQPITSENVKGILRGPITNPHDYKFVMQPRVKCSGQIIFLVATAPSNFELRKAVRETWGQSNHVHRTNNKMTTDQTKVSNNARTKHIFNDDDINTSDPAAAVNFTVIFFLGRVTVNSLNTFRLKKKLNDEADYYGDIVISSFVDTYSNLSLKSVTMLKYVKQSCPCTGMYVVKCDDDTFINLPLMYKILSDKDKEHQRPAQHFVIGSGIDTEPSRNISDKYFMPHSQFVGKKYPPLISGSAYGMKIETANLLYQVALRTPPVRLEDVYLTGICSKRAGVHLEHDHRFSVDPNSYCMQQVLAAGHRFTPERMRTVFSALKKNTRCPLSRWAFALDYGYYRLKFVISGIFS